MTEPEVMDCDSCHLKFDKRYVGWSEWKHAVECSYKAIEDEKIVELELDEAWARVCRLDEGQQEKIMGSILVRLQEVQDRIHSWQVWFERNVP
jgi:hypothetical protein